MVSKVDLLGFFNAPVGSGEAIIRFLPKLMWILILGLFVFIALKFITHRYFIEILEKVKGGYISKGGRYRLVQDKKTKLYHLSPMFGKDKIPYYPQKYFQKVEGIPLIGIKREISLIRLNNRSYKILIPPDLNNDIGIVKYYNNANWYFIEEKQSFLKNLERDKFINFITYAAPMIIIIGALVFWILVIYYQASITNIEAENLQELVRVVSEVK